MQRHTSEGSYLQGSSHDKYLLTQLEDAEGSLDAFANMCVLRCAEDSQQETRTVANSISHEMGKLYPESWAALMKTE